MLPQWVLYLTPFMGSSINIALPSIGKEFALDAVILGWIATLYLLAAAIFLVPFGRVADIYGRKRIFTYGIIIYTVSSLLSAISTSAILLISFRVLQGIGSAMIFGTGVAILTSVFPIGERGKAPGINVAAVYVGLSLGLPIGGFLTQHFGWRSIFLTNVPVPPWSELTHQQIRKNSTTPSMNVPSFHHCPPFMRPTDCRCLFPSFGNTFLRQFDYLTVGG